jgi:hypothetical protein
MVKLISSLAIPHLGKAEEEAEMKSHVKNLNEISRFLVYALIVMSDNFLLFEI